MDSPLHTGMQRLTPEHFSKRFILYASEDILYTIDYERTIANVIFGPALGHAMIHQLYPRTRKIGAFIIFSTFVYWCLIMVNPSAYSFPLFLSACILGIIFNALGVLSMQVDLVILCFQSFEILFITVLVVIMMLCFGFSTDWGPRSFLGGVYIIIAYLNLILMDALMISPSYFDKNLVEFRQSKKEDMKRDIEFLDMNQCWKPELKGIFNPNKVVNLSSGPEQGLESTHKNQNHELGIISRKLEDSGASVSAAIPPHHDSRTKANPENCSGSVMERDLQSKIGIPRAADGDLYDFYERLCTIYQSLLSYPQSTNIFRGVARRFAISQSTGPYNMYYLLVGLLYPIFMYTCIRWELIPDIQERKISFLAEYATTLVIIRSCCLNLIAFIIRRIVLQLFYPYKTLTVRRKLYKIPLLKEWLPIVKIIQSTWYRQKHYQSTHAIEKDDPINQAPILNDKIANSTQVNQAPILNDKIANSTQVNQGDAGISPDSIIPIPCFDSPKHGGTVTISVSSNSEPINCREKEDPGSSKVEKRSDVECCISTTVVKDMEAGRDTSNILHINPDPNERVQSTQPFINAMPLNICGDDVKSIFGRPENGKSPRVGVMFTPLKDEYCINFERSIYEYISRGIGNQFFKKISPNIIMITSCFGLLSTVVLFFGFTCKECFPYEVSMSVLGLGIVNHSIVLLTYSIEAFVLNMKTFESFFLFFNNTAISLSLLTITTYVSNLGVFRFALFFLVILNIIFIDAHPFPTKVIRKRLSRLHEAMTEAKPVDSGMDELLFLGTLIAARYCEGGTGSPKPVEGNVGLKIADIRTATVVYPIQNFAKWRRKTILLLKIYPWQIIASYVMCVSNAIVWIYIFQSQYVSQINIFKVELFFVDLDNRMIIFTVFVAFLIFSIRRLWGFIKKPTCCLSFERRTVRFPLTENTLGIFNEAD